MVCAYPWVRAVGQSLDLKPFLTAPSLLSRRQLGA